MSLVENVTDSLKSEYDDHLVHLLIIALHCTTLYRMELSYYFSFVNFNLFG